VSRTAAKRFYLEEDGWCWFQTAIDDHTDDMVGWHVARLCDRCVTLEPIRQGVRHAFGGFSKEVAWGSGSAATGGRSRPLTPGSTR